MNCPSRTDELPRSDGHNQSPNALSNDLTTNQDLKGCANARHLRRSTSLAIQSAGDTSGGDDGGGILDNDDENVSQGAISATAASGDRKVSVVTAQATTRAPAPTSPQPMAGALLSGDDGTVSAGASGTVSHGGGEKGGETQKRMQQLWRWKKKSASRGSDHSGNGNGIGNGDNPSFSGQENIAYYVCKAAKSMKAFFSFIGPGFIVSVAYIDPGNYATDIAAGASYRFRLLFVVLLSNIFAIFLQSLAIKLGTVSGHNLAEMCRACLPRWLNYLLYGLAEAAIVATDIAEVIGTAIALNMLEPRIPLVAGCAISIADVLIVLIFCRPSTTSGSSRSGSSSRASRGLRIFEMLVAPLVVAVVICFCIQLSLIAREHLPGAGVGQVFRGFLPSSALVQPNGLYQACGILGATVMPHSIYLGSGIVQPRLRDYDNKHGLVAEHEPVVDDMDMDDDDVTGSHAAAQAQSPAGQGVGHTAAAAAGPTSTSSSAGRYSFAIHTGKTQTSTYVPSLAAIRYSLKYSVAELAISLFTFALFVNAAILIVAGAALYRDGGDSDALGGGGGSDIFAMHDLLSRSLSPAAGTIFALALLFSGLSAGVVCTLAGQMVSEGALRWTLAPWLRRLLTRSLSIMPSIVIAGAVGRQGLDKALNASQVALSLVLPFVTAPLLWFTCMPCYMMVAPNRQAGFVTLPTRRDQRLQENGQADNNITLSASGTTEQQPVRMANSWPVVGLGLFVWLMIAAMNLANLVLLCMGR